MQGSSSKNQLSAKRIQANDLTPEDVVVMLVGPTGSGKSTFIENATGITGLVGDGLWSITTDVSVYKLSSLDGLTICLIDTPGIDHTTKADAETVKSISDFILNIYKKKIQLTRLFYFHSITDNRIGVSAGKNLYYIQELLGKDFKKVIVITTMWDEIDSEKLAKTRETELASRWKDMIFQGTTVQRLLRTRQSALDMILPILDESRRKSQGQRKQEGPEQRKQQKLEAQRKQEALKEQRKQEKLEAKRKQEALKEQQKQERLETKRKQEVLKAQQKQAKSKAQPRQQNSKPQRKQETPQVQPRGETVGLQPRQEIEVQRREEVIEMQPRQKTDQGQRGQEDPKAQRKQEKVKTQSRQERAVTQRKPQGSKNHEANLKSESCCVIM